MKNLNTKKNPGSYIFLLVTLEVRKIYLSWAMSIELLCIKTWCAVLSMAEKFENTVDETVVDTVENTIEEAKDDVKLAAKKLTDSDTYLGSNENQVENRDNPDGGKDPMNPEEIAKHEPTAVKRDPNQGTSEDPV